MYNTSKLNCIYSILSEYNTVFRPTSLTQDTLLDFLEYCGQ